MSDNKFDGLEKFFRDRLLEDRTDTNGWDIPDDTVFLEAMEEVNDGDRKRRPIVLWILLGLLTTAGLFYVLKTQSELGELNNKIERLEYANLELEKERNAIQLESMNLEKLKTEEVLSVSDDVVNSEKGSNANVANNTISNIPVSKEDIEAPIGEIREKSKNIQIIEHIPVNQDNVVTISSDERELMVVDNVESLKLGDLDINQQPVAIKLKHVNSSKDEEDVNKGGVKAMVYGGLTFSSLNMNNIGEQPFSLTKYEKYYSGYTVGLGISKDFDKWTLEGNTFYRHLNNQSDYMGEETYESANEILVNNEKVYVGDMGVETPIGRNIAEARFSLGSEEIDDQTVMKNNTLIDQSFDIFGVGLNLNYRFLEFEKFNAFVGAGLSFNYIFDTYQSFDRSLYHGSKMMMNDRKENIQMDGINKLFYSYTSRIGVTYHMNKKVSISLNATYDKSINSIREINLDSDPGTYITNIGTNLSLISQF